VNEGSRTTNVRMNSQNRLSDSLREVGKGVGYGRDLPDSLIVNDCRLPDSSEQSPAVVPCQVPSTKFGCPQTTDYSAELHQSRAKVSDLMFGRCRGGPWLVPARIAYVMYHIRQSTCMRSRDSAVMRGIKSTILLTAILKPPQSHLTLFTFFKSPHQSAPLKYL
jgi:hypothetical protein